MDVPTKTFQVLYIAIDSNKQREYWFYWFALVHDISTVLFQQYWYSFSSGSHDGNEPLAKLWNQHMQAMMRTANQVSMAA